MTKETLTGHYLFKFKQKAKIHTKDGRVIDMKVALVDASRTPTSVNVGGGSEIKIAATVFPYAMSTTKSLVCLLRPSAVQILSLVSSQSNVVSCLMTRKALRLKQPQRQTTTLTPKS